MATDYLSGEDVMVLFNLKCAKTGANTKGQRVHLYLPGGQRVVGVFDGNRYLDVERAFDMGAAGCKMIELDSRRCKWAQERDYPTLDILRIVGGQLIFGLDNNDDLFEGLSYLSVLEEIKLVVDEAFSAEDNFETVPVSPFVRPVPGLEDAA